MTREQILQADREMARELALTYCPFYRAHLKYGMVWSVVRARVLCIQGKV